MRKLLAMCLVLVWACLPASHTLGQDAGEDNLVTVEVTGVGMSGAEAVNDALRKAVEEGAGTFIYSHSETELRPLASLLNTQQPRSVTNTSSSILIPNRPGT